MSYSQISFFGVCSYKIWNNPYFELFPVLMLNLVVFC